MIKNIKKVLTLLVILGFTAGCSVGMPSPLKTGSWYYGEVNSDHIGFEVVFPWAQRSGITSEVEPETEDCTE